MDDDEYTTEYPKAEWGYLKSGVLINSDKGGLIHLIESDEDLESLSRKIHAVEHELYPHAASLFCRGQLRMEGRVVRILA